MSKLSARNVVAGGRKFFAKITEVEEQSKLWNDPEGDRVQNQLFLRFTRPDNKFELEWYNMPDGEEITGRSDLGRLINFFAKMGIDDIGENDYEPIRNLYVQVEVTSRQNRRSGGETERRFPIRRMTAEEIDANFGQGVAQASSQAPQIDVNAVFESISDELVAAVTDLPAKMLYTKIASVNSIATHAQATLIFEKAHGGELLNWLKATGRVSVDESDTIRVAEAATAESE